MGAFTAGHLVVLPFPFSDLSRSKYRPALLIAHAGRGDWIACQITSNPYSDPYAVEITETDFASGGLQRISYARPGKLFTANEYLFSSAPAALDVGKFQEIRIAIIALISG
ncbi:mRNA interferase MazF [Ectothiorhodospira mobilis]|uniref:mRNA interferase MazF n=1 Tax=Ectothiorhodospira mobilis TaxID=195064 RepID=A0A1I4QQ80_ECTMO|nr:MazF family transcriptional regulator [Ectothiorhodospira mobilis]SFM41853.1 mRNA interferase MazF [Ectothiorhodospira mobilis]